MSSSGAQPKASWTDAIFIAFLVSIPFGIAARLAGYSAELCVGITVGATAALCPFVFMILRARRRREWMKKWQGPAHMYREVPPSYAKVVGGSLVEDRGYLEGLIPGYRYQFANDPSGYLLRSFVLLGTWAGIMEFLEKHQGEMIENNSTIPTAGIYMQVQPYQPCKRFKVGGTNINIIVQWLGDLMSLFVPVRNPVADLMINVGELGKTLKSMRDDDDDDGNRKLTISPWTVFAVTFSVLDGGEGFHLVGEHSVDFGSIRRILKRAS